MLGAGKVLGIEPFSLQTLGQLLIFFGNHFHNRQAVSALEGCAQGIGQPFLNAITGHQTVHHHLNAVQVVLVELDVVGKLTHLTVHTHPGKAFSGQATNQFAVGALFATHHWGQQLITGALWQGADLINHLIDGLRPNRAITLRAVGLPGPAIEKAQIVLNFGDRAHRGAGVMARGFLINRDGGRQALDGINIGLINLAQKLTRISRETLDIAALAFSKDRVERERTLAATAHPREHHHLVARDGDINVLEVVLTRTPNADHVLKRTAAEIHGLRQGRVLRLGGGRTHAARISSQSVYEE